MVIFDERAQRSAPIGSLPVSSTTSNICNRMGPKRKDEGLTPHACRSTRTDVQSVQEKVLPRHTEQLQRKVSGVCRVPPVASFAASAG